MKVVNFDTVKVGDLVEVPRTQKEYQQRTEEK